MKDGERDDVDGAVRMERGRVVTYIVYVRVYVYRLIATVYIVYLSARTGRSPSRLKQPRRPAPRRLCPPPSPTARGYETLLAVRSGGRLARVSLSCPLSPSLRFTRGSLGED